MQGGPQIQGDLRQGVSRGAKNRAERRGTFVLSRYRIWKGGRKRERASDLEDKSQRREALSFFFIIIIIFLRHTYVRIEKWLWGTGTG